MIESLLIYRYADVGILPSGTLEDTARELGIALGGVEFSEDCIGRFEEFPAYVARQDHLTFALLGIPLSEYDIGDVKSDAFQLQVESVDTPVGARRENISEEIVIRIQANSSLVCWKLE